MSRPPDGPQPPEKVPPALRPGDTDDILESERVSRITTWGVVTTFVFAGFIFIYWMLEPNRMQAKEKEFEKQGVDRGRYYFALAEDPQTGKAPPRGEGRPAGRPIECARCHGVGGKGGTNDFVDPNTGVRRTVSVPELQTVFSRYEKPPPGFEDARGYITEVIERGRPGTDMPTWGVDYGGPLTGQQISDIVAYLESVQKKVDTSATDGPTIYAQNCSPCHGQSGTGGSGPAFTGGSEAAQFPSIDDHIAFVKSGSKAGTPYGTKGQGTGAMPPWERLTEEQIKAVVDYERSL